jgi:hypothetical protein
MVDTLQLIAVAAYLLWCLCTSLSDRLELPEDDEKNIYESDKTPFSDSTMSHHKRHGGRKGVR